MEVLKKLTDKTTVSSLSRTDKLFANQGSSVKQATVGTLIDVAKPEITAQSHAELDPSINDGAFIMYHRKSDDLPIAVRPADWTSLQTAGEVADGVLIIQGGKHLVIAPTENSGMTWSGSAALVGAAVTDRLAALNDWDGKNKTTAIVGAAALATDTTSNNAAKYCAAYSRVNSNGKGLTAGKWWMPAEAEMIFIWANFQKINYCLALINGATLLQKTWYWTSTEVSSTSAWTLYLSDGNTYYWDAKVSSMSHGRAVSAFIN